MKKAVFFLFGLVLGISVSAGFFGALVYFREKFDLTNPLVLLDGLKPELPLSKYRIENLANLELVSSQIKIIDRLGETSSFTTYVFSYETQGGSMSGQLNLPKNFDQAKVILMMRGYVPIEAYQTGVGTQAAAKVFAEQGFITLAPDFLGFGQSSPDFEDSWEGRFVKPVQMLELINDLKQVDFKNMECVYEASLLEAGPECPKKPSPVAIGIWAHSNGGQVALTTLEGLAKGLPTTLWAPVTVPFPYSVLFFTDELADEGKATRLWLAKFEKSYDVFDFSISQHLDRLNGPIQIHHGTADEAALYSWSLEFKDKILVENKRRAQILKENQTATASAQVEVPPVIDFELFTYEEADHNLKPSWNQVVLRDLEFFQKHLQTN